LNGDLSGWVHPRRRRLVDSDVRARGVLQKASGLGLEAEQVIGTPPGAAVLLGQCPEVGIACDREVAKVHLGDFQIRSTTDPVVDVVDEGADASCESAQPDTT
jgi:hypothetical protein